MKTSQTLDKLLPSLVEAQKSINGPVKNKSVNQANMNYKYADLSSVLEAITEPLSKNSLVVTQGIEIDKEMVTIETILYHVSGEFIGFSCSFMSGKKQKEKDPNGEKDAYGKIKETTLFIPALDPQSIGSTISYARRYSISSLLNISQEDDDCTCVSHTEDKKETAPAPNRPSKEVNYFAQAKTHIANATTIQFLNDIFNRINQATCWKEGEKEELLRLLNLKSNELTISKEK